MCYVLASANLYHIDQHIEIKSLLGRSASPTLDFIFCWSLVRFSGKVWDSFPSQNRKRPLFFICKKRAEALVFGVSERVIYHLRKTKETNGDCGRSFLFVVGSNRVYGMCGFSFEKTTTDNTSV